MKIRLTFKTPDVVDEQRIAEDIALECSEPDVGPDAECNTCIHNQQLVLALIEEFVRYGEYITVEFDTEDKTATVIKLC
jgi:hypothetical protein